MGAMVPDPFAPLCALLPISFGEISENAQKSLIKITFFRISLVIPISFCTFAAQIKKIWNLTRPPY